MQRLKIPIFRRPSVIAQEAVMAPVPKAQQVDSNQPLSTQLPLLIQQCCVNMYLFGPFL